MAYVLSIMAIIISVFEVLQSIYWIKICGEKIESLLYIDEFDQENKTYCLMSLNIFKWIKAQLICLIILKFIYFPHLLSMGNYNKWFFSNVPDNEFNKYLKGNLAEAYGNESIREFHFCLRTFVGKLIDTF